MSSAATLLAFVVHIAGGTVGLIAGVVAVAARKGGPLHRKAGTVFFAAMLTMSVLADYLALVRPGQLPNLFIGTFTIYLLATAWLTARRPECRTGLAEKLLLGLILLLVAPFALLCFDAATGVAPPFTSAIPLKGPVMIALYGFTAVICLAAVLDVRMILAGGVSGVRRIARHLWRMCLGLSMAAGSAFTNGLPRLLPRSVTIPELWLFMPQFACLGVLVFWMVRVRLGAWYGRHGAPIFADR